MSEARLRATLARLDADLATLASTAPEDNAVWIGFGQRPARNMRDDPAGPPILAAIRNALTAYRAEIVQRIKDMGVEI